MSRLLESEPTARGGIMRSAKLRLAIFASLASLSVLLAKPALSQDAADAGASKPEDVQEVVVTGSLIQRPNNTSISPITTVSEESIKQSGAPNLEDALNQLPGFTVGGNSTTGGQGTGGRATINLHGLGTNRNLVLLDGKRLPVSDINGNVDINILPEAIISGVDAITGGASAVYGSDAMSGVVNFRTVRNFDGVKLDLQDSVSQKGDARKVDASLAFGTGFADNHGHVISAFSYSKQDPLLNSARSFFLDKVPSSFIGFGTFVPSATNAPNGAVLTGLFNSYGVAGTINPLASNLGFNDDGSLFTQSGARNYKGPNGSGGYAVVGGNVRMPVGQQGNILNSVNRKTAFWKADYDLTSRLTLYGQFMYVNLTVNSNSGGSLTQFPALTTIPVTNPFIPADLATVLASRPTAAAPFSWRTRYVGIPWKNWDENYLVQQYIGGLKGDIAPGWGFDVYASYDSSVHDSVMHDAVLKSRVQTLLNAPDGGASICAGGFNPFGAANALSLSPACVAYMTKDANSVEDLTQTQIQAQLNGKLFDLGAGPAQVALVTDYRKNTYSYTPDADVTALSGWAPAANVEAFTAASPVSRKSIDVKELAAQIDIPLLGNRLLVREFAIGAAARVSDYSVTGSVKSFEGDIRWRPVDQVLFRGSYQRAVRAPNIGELYSPLGANTQLVIGTPPAAIGDPCDVRSTARTGVNAAQVAALCVAQGIPAALIPTYVFPTTATGQTVAGNTGLVPETANTFNLGMVFNRASDFSLSLDYYNIAIRNVISAVPGLTVLSKCFNLDGSNPSYSNGNLYCQALQRDPATGQLLTVATPYANLGGLKTDGFEIQMHWAFGAPVIGRAGKFYVDPAITYLNSYKVQLLPGAPYLNYTGVSVGGSNPGSVPPRAAPKLKALTTFGFKADRFNVGLRWRYQSSLKDVSAILTPNNVQVGVPAYQLWDLFGTVNVGKSFQVRAGINNLFDKGLPIVASSQNGTDQALYDAIGRAYYLGLKLSF
jgi:outer membrane receptor protein involved in Fe transport